MSRIPQGLSTAFADRYTLRDELGSGGMATVYLADDLKHARKVAIKVLRPELVSVIGEERFFNEIRVTSTLHHPHILPLHDSGSADGFLYYVMPYVAGESLRDWLDREPQLPIDDVVGIAKRVAGALDYAHRQEIVHRDIKPENILLQDNQPILADFGIALAVTAAADGRLTETGLSLGTPHYMSPEQATADRRLDGRSDVYALGCVVYEMLAGEPPFTGPNLQAVIAKHVAQPPADISIVRDAVPRGMSDAILKALAKLPVDRFGTCGEFVAALEASATAKVVEPAEKSIAVLPFDNMSADPENEYFCDGVAEEIINTLAQIPGLRVAGRTSAFSFKGKKEDLRSIGDSLNVRTVLEGSVRKSGNRLRITVQLVDLADGYHLWSERYDRELDDVFAIQEEIANAIAERLHLTLVERPLARSQTENVRAYELYLKGRSLLYQRGLAMLDAAQCFEEALALDPDYALAYAGLADTYSILGYFGLVTPGEASPRARDAALRAADLGPQLPESHCATATIALLFDWDWDLAEREFQKAIELNPAYTQARCWYALLYLQEVRVRQDEALAEARRAAKLDPLSAYAQAVHGLVLWQAGHDAEGLEEALAAVDLDAASFLAKWSLAMCHHEASRFTEAEPAYRQAIIVSGRHAWALSHLGIMYADCGKLSEARAVYAELEARAHHEYVQPSIRAMLAAAVGRAAEALTLAHEACDDRDPFMPLCAVGMPMSKALRSIPRFPEVLERMGLA